MQIQQEKWFFPQSVLLGQCEAQYILAIYLRYHACHCDRHGKNKMYASIIYHSHIEIYLLYRLPRH